ncbi:MAG: type II secretion system F family protein [Candidatus Omnitrophica bacterium]|nr:type II secretion system F family protein [Candidatus Omnitrophota bacterium]MCM8825965.1 type II secretion system F family protein [Candidatus Omnitrophota bacterium]
MSIFVYKVKDETGRVFSGVAEAEDIKLLKKQLREAGYYIINLSPKKSRRSIFSKRITMDDIIIFTHQLTSILEAGLPILKSFEIIWKETDNPQMQVVISQIRNRLSTGASFSQAINEFPDVFPVMYRALLPVAETGAGFIPILKRISEYLNNQKEFIGKIKKATSYPMFVLGFAILVVILMLVIVVPTFQKVFAKIKVELPYLTQLIIKLSLIMRSFIFWIIVGLVFLGIIILYKKLSSHPQGRLFLDRLKLKIPIFGRIFYIASLSRLVRSLGLLLGSGVPVSQSIEVAKATILNKEIENHLVWVGQRITEGEYLSEALRSTNIFPSLLIEMVAVGEHSGSLAEMLIKVSQYFEEELDKRMNKFLSLLEPALIIIVGGIVMFVLLAIYLPIFKLWQGLPRS